MTILYFRVEPNSEASAIIDGMRAKKAERAKIVRKVHKELNLAKDQDLFGTDHLIMGVGPPMFEPARLGWRWDRKRGINIPDRKTQEGREVVKLLGTIPSDIDTMHESQRIFEHKLVMGAEHGGICLRFASFGASKNGAVCRMHASVKKAAKKWPAGLTEITGTEAEQIVPTIEEG
jgi:hypothetical protein